MGVTSAAVPVKKSSSATYSASRGAVCSGTSSPITRASVITVSRVMPGSTAAAVGGVKRTPSRTRNRFSPGPSLSRPLLSSAMASA
jgi:hypothetical protein